MSGAILPLISGVLPTLLPGVSGDWRARMRRASFRGVPFYVDSASGEYGRRYVMHQYPGRDLPYAEDMGRAQRQWTFQAYTIGSRFLAEREALVQACEAPGPGRLIHPLLGSFNTVCTSCTFSDRRDVGGFSTLNLSFAEAGALRQPEATEDTSSWLEIGAASLGGATRLSFLENFTIGDATFLGPMASEALTALADRLDFLSLPIDTSLDRGPLTSALNVLRAVAPTVVANPGALFNSVSNAFGAWTDANQADRGLVGMLDIAMTPTVAPLVASVLPFIPPRTIGIPDHSSPLRSAEDRNRDALRALEQRLALREIGYIVPGTELESTQQAITIRAKITQAFDDAANAAARAKDDAVFEALTGLLARVLAHLDAVIAQLPSLVPYQTPRPLNALVLAWTLYQDCNRDLELVARTNAPNPAWLPTFGLVLNR